MANNPFKLKSQGSSFKEMGSSPAKQGRNVGGRGFKDAKLLDVSKYGGILKNEAKFNGNKSSTTTSVTPKVQFGRNKKGSIGVNFSGKISGDKVPGVPVDPFNAQKSQISLTGKRKFGGGTGPKNLHTGFKGSASGSVGVKGKGILKEDGKLAYKGKVTAGVGNKKWNLKAFGEHASKHHIEGRGTKVGISGKRGIVKGSVGYNLKTKKPQFGIGLDI
jgi:hypothetical protein